MERFRDICDLLDSIKSQTLISQKVVSQQSAVPNRLSPLPDSKSKVFSPESSVKTAIPESSTLDSRLLTIETIFVAQRSRKLYERVKERLSARFLEIQRRLI